MLRAVHLFGHLVDELEDGGKVCRSVKRHRIDRVLVSFNYTIQSVDFWVKDIAVEGKAVVTLVCVGRDGSTEAQSWDLLVAIVVLQDTTHGAYSIQVLVALHIEVVERTWARRRSVGCSEINSHGQADLAASEHIVKEGVALGDFQPRKSHLVVATEWALLLVCNGVLLCAFFEHGKSEGALTDMRMLARLSRLVKVYLNLSFYLVAC